jgi:hypothetical protein
MQYAAHLPSLPSTRSMVAPVVALLVGAGAATGAYAVIDNSNGSSQIDKVVVLERPAAGEASTLGGTAAGIASHQSSHQTAFGKDEGGIAAAVDAGLQHSSGSSFGKDEAGIASAVNAGLQRSSDIQPRGSKASAVGSTSPASQGNPGTDGFGARP